MVWAESIRGSTAVVADGVGELAEAFSAYRSVAYIRAYDLPKSFVAAGVGAGVSDWPARSEFDRDVPDEQEDAVFPVATVDIGALDEVAGAQQPAIAFVQPLDQQFI